MGRRRSKGTMFKVNSVTGCWDWLGYVNPDGYGKLNRKGESQLAHRAIYEAFKRKIPDGMHTDHVCRNRRCVNPDHIEIVTNLENVHRGKRCKLTKEKVGYIRFLHENGCSRQAIAALYDVTPENISAITTGKTWKGVNYGRKSGSIGAG